MLYNTFFVSQRLRLIVLKTEYRPVSPSTPFSARFCIGTRIQQDFRFWSIKWMTISNSELLFPLAWRQMEIEDFLSCLCDINGCQFSWLTPWFKRYHHCIILYHLILSPCSYSCSLSFHLWSRNLKIRLVHHQPFSTLSTVTNDKSLGQHLEKLEKLFEGFILFLMKSFWSSIIGHRK